MVCVLGCDARKEYRGSLLPSMRRRIGGSIPMYSFWGCGCARMVSQRSPRCRRLRTRSGTDHVDCLVSSEGTRVFKE